MGDAEAVVENNDADEVPAKDTSKPTIPFDVSTTDLIIDFRAVCSLPFDPNTEGVKSLRAIKFGKGRAVHVPNQAGKLFVFGEWSSLQALTKVYFTPSTHREPELLLNFVDYGFANNEMSGISVETLLLPLLVSKGVYQNMTRLTRIEDVVGFSPINHTKTPWSVNLKPALQKQEMFKSFKISMPADVNKWLSSMTMVERVELLAKRARTAMVEEIKELERQDPAQATKTKAMFEAKLASILEAIEAMPPAAYDARLATRVMQLVEDRDREGDPVWLTSPVQTGMREGKAEFLRTRLHRAPPRAKAPTTTADSAPAPAPAPAGAPAPAPTPAPQQNGDDELELSDDPESEANSEVREVEPPRESGRAKRPPARLSHEQKRGAPKAKQTKTAEAPVPAPAPADKNGYVRGPYKKTSASAAKSIAKAEKEKAKKELSLTADKLELASLKMQLKAALDSKKAAEEQLKQGARMVELEVAKAYAEGEKKGLEVAGEEYKKGVQAGAAIAQGRAFSFSPSPTPRSTSGRSGVSSRSFGGSV